MKNGGTKEAGTVRTIPAWMKILILLHVFAVIVWTLPQPPDDVKSGQVAPKGTSWLLYWNMKYLKSFDPIRSYLLSTGAWQYWDMFAPEPANTDFYCTAEIEYFDGTRRPADYPRIYSLPIPMKYVKERYRKFFERARDLNNPSAIRLWPVFAQTLAFHSYTDPKNPPLVVHLFQHELPIAGPGQKQATEYQSHEYYAYAVDQAWLKRARGMP